MQVGLGGMFGWGGWGWLRLEWVATERGVLLGASPAAAWHGLVPCGGVQLSESLMQTVASGAFVLGSCGGPPHTACLAKKSLPDIASPARNRHSSSRAVMYSTGCATCHSENVGCT